MTNIGLIDYDVLRTKYYLAPNYDLGVIYAYFKDNPNINIRLVSSLSPTNLQQYDKIYIFKMSQDIPHPSGFIGNYYKLPIEEYGPGFVDKPLRPFQLETQLLKPDFSCYNNMLRFSVDRPRHYLSWTIDKQAKGGKYKPLRLYEKIDGEELKRDYPMDKYNLIYDDPVEILNSKEKLEYFMSFIHKKHKFFFTQRVDVSRINDTNIIERVIVDKDFVSFRKKMVASIINDNFQWLVNEILSKKYNKLINIMVKLPVSEGEEKCFETLLLMNYYNHKAKFRLNLRPIWEKEFLSTYTLALLAYKYMSEKPYTMSYYEYVFNIAYLRMGVPKELIHTGEDRYEYIFKQYGMAPLLITLEDWLIQHPEFQEQIFIGGSSDYGKQRKEYYDSRRGKIAFRTSIDNIS